MSEENNIELIEKMRKQKRLEAAKDPSPLPIGMAEFNEWSEDIIDLYDLPNNDSIKFAIASMIMHLGPKDAFVPKYEFYLMVRAGMSKQVASAAFREIKLRHEASEATVPTTKTPDETL